MKLTKYVAAAAALSLAAAPALAESANPAASLSLSSSARAGDATSKHDSDLLGGGLIIAIIAGVAIIVGVVVVADNSSSK